MNRLLAILALIFGTVALLGQTAPVAKMQAFGPVTWTYSASPSCSLAGVTGCYVNFYRCTGSAATCVVGQGTWTLVTPASSPAPVSGSWTDQTPPAGATVLTYYATAVASGNGWTDTESGASNEAQVTFQGPPQSPVIVK